VRNRNCHIHVLSNSQVVQVLEGSLTANLCQSCTIGIAISFTNQDAVASTANAPATAVNLLKTSLVALRSASLNIPVVPGLAPALDGPLVTQSNHYLCTVQVNLSSENMVLPSTENCHCKHLQHVSCLQAPHPLSDIWIWVPGVPYVRVHTGLPGCMHIEL
jgi:hypothetical protein